MSSRLRTVLVALLGSLLGLALVPAVPATAADKNPELDVRIQSLAPSRLTPGSTITMTGTVTNHDSHRWTSVQAYLVIPASPFTTRAQIQQAVDSGAAYTGLRVIEPGAFDDIGDLAPGQTRAFRVRVPYDQLGVTGAEGVYPVGVQILATDTDGTRSGNAVARATTFVPFITGKRDPVTTSVVWPFLMPDHLDRDGDYADPLRLLAAVSAGGRLRNLLDLAASTPTDSSTVVVDPALLVGVDALEHGRHLPDGVELDMLQRAEAGRFLSDLLTLARTRSCWVLDYGRPDDLALSLNSDLRPALASAIRRATDSTLETYQLSGRHVSWPTIRGVTSGLLRDLRGAGDSPVIVTPSSLPGWDHRLGSVVQYVTPQGPMPLVVNDVLDANVPGKDTVVTLRQRLLSKSALAVLERAVDPQSHANSIALVDPRWNPGTGWADGNLQQAFTAPFTRAASLDSVLTRPLSRYRGKVPASAKDLPLSRAQLRAADDIVTSGRTLSSVIPQSDAVDDALARDVAEILGVRWRKKGSTAMAIARARAERATSQLGKITIKGPPSVTLSSAEGAFPITIRNGTDESIRVGISLDSSNPALDVPDIKPIDIDAGERRTLTVEIDLGRQSTTSLTARLQSADGTPLGEPAKFNVRSSKIGVMLWIAMGLAVLLVLASLVRRFSGRRHGTSERPVDDDA